MVDRRTPGQEKFGHSVASEETFPSARNGCVYTCIYIYTCIYFFFFRKGVFLSLTNQSEVQMKGKQLGYTELCQ